MRGARWGACAIATTLVLSTAIAARPACAAAAEKAIWGPLTLPDGSSALPLYDKLGVDTLQLTLSWAEVAPTRPASPRDPADPAYRWPIALTTAQPAARSHGIELALRVSDTPGWANGGRSRIWAPRRPRDYADFLAAAARRYPGVRRWMVWGEPNRGDRFRPNRAGSAVGPRAYAQLLDAAYGALKGANRANRVIGGMTWTGGTVTPAVFLRDMRLPGGRRPRLDWFGHNPFPFRYPNLALSPVAAGTRDISDIDTLSGELTRAYHRRVPLWLSEYTIQSDHGSHAFATYVSRAAQARFLTAAWQIADDLGGAVAGIGWYALTDEPPAAQSANWGLLTASLRPKPAFAAYARAPGERLRPAVVVATRTSRAALGGPGLAVHVTPQASGSIVAQLRVHGRVRATTRTHGRSGIASTLRLRLVLGAGPCVVTVRAPRGATVRRLLRVR